MKSRISTATFWIALAAATFLAIGLFQSPTLGQQDETKGNLGPDEARIETLDFVEASLVQVISVLTSDSGAEFVISDQEALAGKKVTASLRDVTVDEALTTILKGAGVPWYKDEMGVYMIGCQPPNAPEPQTPVAPVVEPEAEKAPPEEMALQKVILSNMPVDDIYYYLLTGHLPIRRVELSTGLETRGARAGQTALGAGTQPAGAQSFRPDTSGNGQWRMEELPWEARNDAADSDLRLGYKSSGYYGDLTRDPAQIRPPTGGGATQPPTGAGAAQSFIPEGVTITPFPLDNSLLIRGPADQVKWLIDTVIPYLDIQPKQVEIKASFVTMTIDQANQWGIVNWATHSGDLTVNYTPATALAGTVRVGYAVGDFDVALQALQTRGKAKVVNAPIITTMNNQTAQIALVDGYPIARPVINITPGGGVQTVYVPDYVYSQTTLSVLPRINGDGTINVQIMPSVGSNQPFVNVPQYGPFPSQHQQTLFTERVVADGQTIVLGGLTTKNTTYSEDRVPLLSDIPLIGPLFFRTKTNTVSDQELLIFLTPRVIPWPGLPGYAGLAGSGD
jgi:hypothetical protein